MFEKKWGVIALLGLMCLLFFGNTLNNDFSLDDSYLIKEVPKGEVTISDVFKPFGNRFDFVDYRPIPVASFVFEKWLTGENDPHFSHFVNLLLYFLICVAIFFVSLKLPATPRWWFAISASLIFLAHPSHANVVNNLKSRDNLFSMLFGLIAFNFALKPVQKLSDYFFPVASFLLMVLALFSKLDSLGFIFIIPCALVILKKQSWKTIVLTSVAVASSYLFIRGYLIEKYVPIIHLNEPIVFTENPIVKFHTAGFICAQSISTLWEYVKMMIIPGGYYFYYGYDMIPLKPLTDISIIAKLLFHLVVLSAAIYFLRKNRFITFSIGFFYLALAYCANLQQPVAGIIADRYSFIASLGFCLLLAELLTLLGMHPAVANYFSSSRSKQKKEKKPQPYRGILPFALLTALVILIYFPFTYTRNADWKNIFTLLEADMPNLSRSYEANRIAATQYINRSTTLENFNDRTYGFQKALQYARQANSIYPGMIHEQESEGICYYMLGMQDSCFNHFAKVRAIFDTTSVGWEMTGDIFQIRNQYDSAEISYKKVLSFDPENEQVRMKLQELKKIH